MTGERLSRSASHEGVRRGSAAWLKDNFLPLVCILIALAAIVALTIVMVRWLPPDLL